MDDPNVRTRLQPPQVGDPARRICDGFRGVRKTHHRSFSGWSPRYAPAVPILRQDDPRVGCLAVPICIVAGFIVGALIAAAFGVSAGWSSTIGLIVGGIGAVVAVVVLRRDT